MGWGRGQNLSFADDYNRGDGDANVSAFSSLVCTGFLRSGKSQGILKYCSLDQLFMHYFYNFCRLLGALPPAPTGAPPL